ncbi:MAG: hypothetical protein Q8O57_07845, partial [Kiritimatiellota bacterium]|nr:hypothetical protein [Kiritimatiellota bacterium]
MGFERKTRQRRDHPGIGSEALRADDGRRPALTIPKPDAQALSVCAKKYAPDLQAFLRDLVRIPSVNGREIEKPVAERIIEEAWQLGFKAGLAAMDESRPNALVEFGGGECGFALIGQMDTVTEGKAEDWS